MRTILLAAFVVGFSVLANGQTPAQINRGRVEGRVIRTPGTTPQGARFTADEVQRNFAIDWIQLRGNVTIATLGVVITADSAIIERGEVRLGANARVKLVDPSAAP